MDDSKGRENGDVPLSLGVISGDAIDFFTGY